MKKKINLLCAILFFLPVLSFAQSQDLKPGVPVKDPSSGATWTPVADNGLSYSADKQYIIFKFWNEADPATEKEKKAMEELKHQLAGKDVQVIEFKYSSKEEIEKLLKDNGIEEAVVSTDDGIDIRCKDSHFNTTSSKAIFVFEGKFPLEAKRPIILIYDEKDETSFLKRFFKLRSFS